MTRFDDDFTTWSGTEAGNPYYFTGRCLDELNGGGIKIMYYRNRYYDPTNGRFLSHDPLGIRPKNKLKSFRRFENWKSLYEYVKSNPVQHTDSMGLMPSCPVSAKSTDGCDCGDLVSVSSSLISISFCSSPGIRTFVRSEKKCCLYSKGCLGCDVDIKITNYNIGCKCTSYPCDFKEDYGCSYGEPICP